MHRGNAHQRRIDADAGEGADPRKDRQPQRLGFRLTHHHHRRRAVIDAGGVAGGYRSETIEGRLQAGQPFRAGIHPRLFIGIHGARRAVMLGNDRDNLIAKASGINRLARLLLRAERPGVLQFAADAIFPGEVLRRDAHMIIVEGVPQAVMDQAVNQLAVAQLGAGAAVGEDMRSAAHVLLATGDHHVRLPALDRLGGEVQGFQAGTADVVNGDRRYGVGQPAANSRLTGRVLPGSRGQHLAEDHLIHALRIDSRLLHQRLHHHAAQLNG